MKWLFTMMLGVFFHSAFSQSTLTLTEADSLLQANNLSLLAYRYQVDASKAQIIQARLFDNPVINTEWSFYNPVKESFFDTGPTGQKIISIQQEIKLAGQRNKAIRMATAQASMSEYEFFDLARTLKFISRSSFYTIYYANVTLQNIESQLNLLDETVRAYRVQYEKGNISLKDYTRLQVAYYELNNSRSEIIKDKLEAQQTLQTLLGIREDILPLVTAGDTNRYRLAVIDRSIPENFLLDRPDIQAAKAQHDMHQHQLALQRSLAVPNLTVGAVYDQAGSYINNYTALSLGIEIPIFNRNQGNIKAAEAYVMSSQAQYEQKKLEAQNQWMASYQKLEQIEKEFQKIDNTFYDQLEELSKNLISNYTKNNISLLEFTDLFESYNEAVIQINNLKTQRIKAYEELSYFSGIDLIK